MNRSFQINLHLLACLLIAGFAPKEPSIPTELILYNWVEYMPQSMLGAFAKEYDITVKYVTYESQEETADNIQTGNFYDLVVPKPEIILLPHKRRKPINEAVYAFIEPDILNNKLIYPPNEYLINAELILPLSLEGQQFYEEICERFSTAPQSHLC